MITMNVVKVKKGFERLIRHILIRRIKKKLKKMSVYDLVGLYEMCLPVTLEDKPEYGSYISASKAGVDSYLFSDLLIRLLIEEELVDRYKSLKKWKETPLSSRQESITTILTKKGVNLNA